MSLPGEHTDGNHGSTLYDWAVRQPDLAATISGLDEDALRVLHAYLGHFGDTGVPGLIHGLLLDEAAHRFLTAPRQHL
jgi:hypothetical protein